MVRRSDETCDSAHDGGSEAGHGAPAGRSSGLTESRNSPTSLLVSASVPTGPTTARRRRGRGCPPRRCARPGRSASAPPRSGRGRGRASSGSSAEIAAMIVSVSRLASPLGRGPRPHRRPDTHADRRGREAHLQRWGRRRRPGPYGSVFQTPSGIDRGDPCGRESSGAGLAMQHRVEEGPTPRDGALREDDEPLAGGERALGGGHRVGGCRSAALDRDPSERAGDLAYDRCVEQLFLGEEPRSPALSSDDEGDGCDIEVAAMIAQRARTARQSGMCSTPSMSKRA